MREFLDVYYWTAESGITPRDDPFPPTDPLPDIGQNTQVSMGSRKPSHVGSVFRKVLVLVTKHMNIRRVIINHGFVWLQDLWNVSIIMMLLWWFLKRKSLEFYHVWVTRGILPFVGLHSQFPWCILIYHVHRWYTDYWMHGWNYCLLGCTEGGGSKSVSYWATLMTSDDNQV